MAWTNLSNIFFIFSDDDLRHIVRGSGNDSKMGVEDASITLAEAQSSIVELFGQIKDIKSKAAESEATVRDITRKFHEFLFSYSEEILELASPFSSNFRRHQTIRCS